ncbi:MAG: NAD(P)-dependent oxidoreductase [Thermomicrobiales bacterium]|nr:NAD(P)-dependent oxidoreductase [Thermomicrobiales bacterium]
MVSSPKSIAVTGASGKAGFWITNYLTEKGFDVLATDVLPRREGLMSKFLRADLTEYGDAIEILNGQDAVVHMANIPASGIYTESHTFNTNIVMNENVFQAAGAVGLKRVVWASSETTLGLPFDPPLYAPVDEEHYPHPTSTYALSKVLTEEMARHHSRWWGIPFVGLRFTNIFAPEDYAPIADYHRDPVSRSWNLFGYVDVRDCAQACELALQADIEGADSMIIAAADTIIDEPSQSLAERIFPGLEFRRDIPGYETLLSIEKAKRVLGYAPAYSWRNQVEPNTHRLITEAIGARRTYPRS